MATPKKFYCKVTPEFLAHPASDRAVVFAWRFIWHVLSRWASDQRLTWVEAVICPLSVSQLAAIASCQRRDIAEKTAREFAEVFGATFKCPRDTGTDFYRIEWLKFAEIQDRPTGKREDHGKTSGGDTPDSKSKSKSKSTEKRERGGRRARRSDRKTLSPHVGDRAKPEDRPAPEKLEAVHLDALRAWCSTERPDLEPHIEELVAKMLYHARANGWRRVDWVAAAQKWIRDERAATSSGSGERKKVDTAAFRAELETEVANLDPPSQGSIDYLDARAERSRGPEREIARHLAQEHRHAVCAAERNAAGGIR